MYLLFCQEIFFFTNRGRCLPAKRRGCQATDFELVPRETSQSAHQPSRFIGREVRDVIIAHSIAYTSLSVFFRILKLPTSICSLTEEGAIIDILNNFCPVVWDSVRTYGHPQLGRLTKFG